MQNPKQLSDAIKSRAKSLGLMDCAIIPATFLAEENQHYHDWLSAGMHGDMGYMYRNIDKRLDPQKLMDGAKTIIVVLQNYYPREKQHDTTAPVISKYAFGTDYHFVMKDKLKNLLTFIQSEIGPCNGRPLVDSAPVLERAWARKAGLGWVGKNSNLISVEHGSFFFIGELILDLELPFDEPKMVADHCGRCTRCIDACPTKAIIADKVVDARRCISYQTIELKGNLDENLKGQFQNRIFGCDICQDVCPWNLKSEAHNEAKFSPKPKMLEMSGSDWYRIDKPLFSELFEKSAVKRTGFEGLIRNLEFIRSENNGKKV